MNETEQKQRSLAVHIAQSADEKERTALLAWAQELLKIRDSSLPVVRKAKDAVKLTAQSKIVIPATKLIGRDIKRLAWDERKRSSRFGLIGIAIGATIFGGQGAGIAALGTAIGVPLWVVLGAGGAFAGMLVDELTGGDDSNNPVKTTYTTIDAIRDKE